MKKIFLLSAALLSVIVAEAQNVDLEDLKTPAAPGFQLLDISPTSIERPQNPKALGATLLSWANNGSSIPKNFAMEVTPYWYLKDSKATALKFLNIREDGKPTYSSGILKKLSLSMASVYNDTVSGSLLAKTNYLSFGARTNLFTLRLAKQNEYLMGTLEKISEKTIEIKPKEISTDARESSIKKLESANRQLEKRLLTEKDPINITSYNTTLDANRAEIDRLATEVATIEDSAPDVFLKVIKNDKELQSLMDELDTPPLLQLEGAFAYSEAFPDNTTANRRFNRSGIWGNLAINSSGMLQKASKYNVAAVVLVKYINDNLFDDVNNVFERENALDLGIKIDFTIKDFTLAFEHLHRKYHGDNGKDSNRNVFLMQYKISDGVYFTGSYGKNFGEVNNLFSLFGINYGFGPKALKPK